MGDLFQAGMFELHSGALSSWKIECDVLSERELHLLARVLLERLPLIGSVEGVPRGGLRLAAHLQALIVKPISGALLIVDDVLTTGASMEAHRAGREAIGAVLFARGPVPAWVTPLFTLTAVK